MGSVVNYLSLNHDPDRRATMPDYTYVPNRLGALQGINRPGQYAGWLGSAYNALATDIRKRGKRTIRISETATTRNSTFASAGSCLTRRSGSTASTDVGRCSNSSSPSDGHSMTRGWSVSTTVFEDGPSRWPPRRRCRRHSTFAVNRPR
ncbi:MAG: hypothetical protein Ct9H300mP1_37600 [Planctomycetaceae bacterium]|nr:MAG: hypothetical protein Ct9H300mP1_37600 [Planctomycetaceae bacterium]